LQRGISTRILNPLWLHNPVLYIVIATGFTRQPLPRTRSTGLLRLTHDNIGVVDHFGKRLHVANIEGTRSQLLSRLLLLTVGCALTLRCSWHICVQIRGLWRERTGWASRRTVWHHPNTYYHVNGESGDDNGESISAIQITGLRCRSIETRWIEENKKERGRLFSYDCNRAQRGVRSF